MTKTLIGNIKGPKGDTGPTPTIGSNGNWFINGVDTNKPSRGVQGPQGIQGPAGQGVTAGAFKVTRWDNVITAQNGCHWSKYAYVERADFVNFSILAVYSSWLATNDKITAGTNVVAGTFPGSIMNGYTKMTPLGVCRHSDPVKFDIFVNTANGVQLYTRQDMPANAGFSVEMAYLIHN